MHARICARRVFSPHRERQTIPQGQTSIPRNFFLTPTAKARPDQAAIATAAETPGTTHRARPRICACLVVWLVLVEGLGVVVDELLYTHACIHAYTCMHLHI